jgi:two-component system, chemotaxis family, sensor kinase CheA
MDELLAQFLLEAPELVQQASDDLVALERSGDAVGGRGRLDGAFRAIHTLKGSVALFDMAPLGEALHAAEDWLAAVRAGGARLERGRALDRTLDLLGRMDGWFAELGPDGALPAGAEGVCRAVAAALRAQDGAEAPPPPPAPTADPPAWAAAVLEGGTAQGGAGALVRYAPDAEAFFRGEDPLALVARLPSLAALKIEAAEPWPEPERYDPFRCRLVFIARLSAGPDEARAVLRLAGGEVEVVGLPGARPDAEPLAAPDRGARRLRVDPARVDALLGVANDLVAAVASLGLIEPEGPAGRALAGTRQRLERLAGDLHGAVMRVRLAPLSRTFERLPRLVRDLSVQLGKPVRLELEGEALEADRGLVDGLFEPLLHLVRNALDHGIEPAAMRAAAGKPAAALIRIAAHATGDRLEVLVADDGAGLDPARIRRAAADRGLAVPQAAEGTALYEVLFSPGFSTAERVSDVSGRGVGLDSVRRAVEAIGGQVWLESDPGQGARARLSLPLGAVLTRMALVRVGPEVYGAPLSHLVETFRLPPGEVQRVGQGLAAVWRERTLPLLHLHDRLQLERGEAKADLQVLVVDTAAGERVGLVADAVVGRLEGVVRPLGGLLAGCPGVLGTTLGADGSVLFVLDLAELGR